MSHHKLNKQVIRTRKWIFEALMKLLETKSFEDITITEITDTAGVARQTFYRNYESKADVVQKFIDIIFDEFEHGIVPGMKDIDVYQLYFCTLANYRDQLIRLCRLCSEEIIYKTFIQYNHIFIQMLSLNTAQTQNNDFSVYFVKYQLGGIIALTIEWISDNMQSSTNRMARILYAFTKTFSADKRFLPNIISSTEDDHREI